MQTPKPTPTLYAKREIYSTVSESKFMNSMMLVLFGVFVALAIILPEPPPSLQEQIILRAIMIFFAIVMLIFIPRYTLSFREDALVIIIGYFPIVKVRLDRNKITYVGLIEWSPLKDFGGAGIKTGHGKFKNYWCFNYLTGKGIEVRTTKKNYLIEVPMMERQRLISRIGDYPRGKIQQSQK